MNLPSVNDINCQGLRVLVRGDLDIDVNEAGTIENDTRLRELLPTLQMLLEKGAKQLVIIGHRGRPENVDPALSLKACALWLKTALNREVFFVEHQDISVLPGTVTSIASSTAEIVVMENLRFYPGEEANDAALAETMKGLGELYVNEAFATSHRAHMSVSALPKTFKQLSQGSVFAGLHVVLEVQELSKMFTSTKHPIIYVLSGLKKDKLDNLEELKSQADKVLIGGRLPDYLPEDLEDPKLVVARLLPDKEDITVRSIENFEEIIKTAGTIFLSGPLGKYEEEGHRQGTERIYKAIAEASCLKIAAGGDTTSAINFLNLKNNFDWVSTGGGAALEFVAKRRLPGLDILMQ